jgi:uncharacterized membrane protein YcaP (DUF421 family)
MKPEEIHLNDWQRIFIGDVPGGFYLEVILRVVIIYLILMVSMRLMGKRMASQLSRNEMIAMVSLAAAIGVPIQSPDRGVLPIVVIALIVVVLQQLVAKISTRSEKLETLTQGDMTVLVEDSHLNLKNMQKTGITKERAFAQLRNSSIKQLGEVKRLYFEAGGSFTLIQNQEVMPGLGIIPGYDTDFMKQIYQAQDKPVCENCGLQAPQGFQNKFSGHKCKNCGNSTWVKAVV